MPTLEMGPLLFLLYINHLPNDITDGRLFIYAADTTIILADPSIINLQQEVNGAIGPFNDWCQSNHLIINSNKTSANEFTGRFRVSSNLQFYFKLSEYVHIFNILSQLN